MLCVFVVGGEVGSVGSILWRGLFPWLSGGWAMGLGVAFGWPALPLLSPVL